MDDGSRILWLIITLLFAFAFYFATAETAFSSVSKVRIKAAADRGSKKAAKALRVLEHFDRAVTTILIGTNITHLGIASLVTVLVMRSSPALVSISTLLTTIAVFFLSEMLPKSIAKRYSEPLAFCTAASLLFFMRLFSPVSRVLTAIGQGAAKKLGQEEEITVTEEELHGIIESMADDGMLDEEQSELITSALEFGDIAVKNIFTPLSHMEQLSLQMQPMEVTAFLLSHQHSRYPVYDEHKGNIVGTLQMRKYLKAARKDPQPGLLSLIDPPLFVPSSIDVSELIRQMNRHKVSLAIVRDEKGQVCGMLTIEDALDELISGMDADAVKGGIQA